MRNHRIALGMLALLLATVCSAPAEATGRGKGVNFPVSCSAAAQQAFNEALAALHSFWYAQAAKEFRAIAEREPDCYGALGLRHEPMDPVVGASTPGCARCRSCVAASGQRVDQQVSGRVATSSPRPWPSSATMTSSTIERG